MTYRTIQRALLVAGLLTSARPADAVVYTASDFGASPVAIGAGARALGMGGAFTAVADDASASTWNPAGMTQLERLEAGASAGYYRTQIDHDGERGTEADIDLDHISLAQPFFAGGFQQTLAIDWQRQFDFSRRFTIEQSVSIDDGLLFENSSRDEVDQDGAYSTIGASYAIELLPGLALGVSGRVWNDDLTGRSSYSRRFESISHTRISIFGIPINESTDHIDELWTYRVREGYSAVIGAWWQATPRLTFGVALKPKFKLRLSADAHRRQTTEDITGGNTIELSVNESSSVDFHYPTSATAGMAWRHLDRQTVALDVTWTHWDDYFTEQDGDVRSPINPYINPNRFDDGWTARLGYEHVLIFSRVVAVGRCGAFYEQIPAAEAAPDVTTADMTHATHDDFFGFTLGASLCQRHTIYDLGAQLRYGEGIGAGQYVGPDRTVDHLSIIVRAGLTWQF
jgi:hypothetical protein